MVVVMTGSDDIMSPFRLQVMDIGMSPLVTEHVSWTNLPWLTESNPKENGTITGGSAMKYFQCQFQIYH